MKLMKRLRQRIATFLIAVMALSMPLTSLAATMYVEGVSGDTPILTSGSGGAGTPEAGTATPSSADLEDEDATEDEVEDALAALTAAVQAVEIAPFTATPGREELGSLIAELEKLDEGDYISGWDEFLDALHEAMKVYEDENATQYEIIDALALLGRAEAALVKVPLDTASLLAAIAEAEALSEDDYTSESWEALHEALEEAGALLVDESATQDEIDAAVIALNTALEALVKAEKTITPSWASLSNAIAEAEALSEEDYTSESWASLQEALELAKGVLESSSATEEQDEVYAALDVLTAALAALVKSEETAVPNTASLSDAIAGAEALSEEDYTPESWEALEAALEAAQAVLADEGATQDEIDAAVAALNTAVAALEKTEEETPAEPAAPDEDDSETPDDESGSDSSSGTEEGNVDTLALREAISTAESLTSGSYTTASWAALETALANAKAVLADEDATQEEADETVQVLLAAIEALVKKSSSGRSGSSSSSGGGGGGGSSSVSTSSSGSWQHDGIGWWYQYTSGSYPKSAWLSVSGQWYYFNEEGYACYGWQKVNGSWYYLDPTNCNMLSGWHEDPQDGYWYYLNPGDGRMLTGWQQINGVYYFFNPIEPDQPTWTYDAENSAWNYTNEDHRPFGSMYAGETTPDGYEVDENGAWIR